LNRRTRRTFPCKAIQTSENSRVNVDLIFNTTATMDV
jgi:hypothetical protein